MIKITVITITTISFSMIISNEKDYYYGSMMIIYVVLSLKL